LQIAALFLERVGILEKLGFLNLPCGLFRIDLLLLLLSQVRNLLGFAPDVQAGSESRMVGLQLLLVVAQSYYVLRKLLLVLLGGLGGFLELLVLLLVLL